MFSPTRDVNAIRDTISRQEANLARLEDQIVRLLEARAKETLTIETHLALHAAIRLVPNEVLVKIFLACMPTGKSVRDQQVTPWVAEAPMSLSLVCKKRRSVTISTPSLWTSLNMSAMRTSSPEFISNWFGRSKGHPLTLSMSLVHMMGNEATTGPYYNRLSRFTEQLQHLKLEVGLHADLSFATSHATTEVAAPRLETFEFTSTYDMAVVGDAIEREINTMLHNAPRLYSFCWSNKDYYREVPACALNLPWKQLSQLQLGRMMSYAGILSILTQTPRLESCAFELVHLTSQLPLTTPTIVLTHLQSLLVHTTLDPGPFSRSNLGMRTINTRPMNCCPGPRLNL